MNISSFFCGAGGLDLGFCLSGHKIIWANDFDSKAVESYNFNIGKYLSHYANCCDIVELLDTTNDNINKIIPDSDLIIGGFPCQGFTIANLDRSMKDQRNFLYLELLKGISVKQPKYFLLENVKGLENMENGTILPLILNDLENAGTVSSKIFPSQLGVGYRVVYNVINALNLGVPENRERVIILGIRNDIYHDCPLKKYILDEQTNSKYDKRKVLSIPITHSKNGIKIEELSPNQIVNGLYEKFINGEIVPTTQSLRVKEKYKIRTMGDAIKDLPTDYSDKINNHNGSKCIVNIKNNMGNRATDYYKPSPTIMGRGSGTGGPLIPPHPLGHRRLTVREVARIQTFPDQFYFFGSNSCGYRQIGNAVPVLMSYKISQIFNFELD